MPIYLVVENYPSYFMVYGESKVAPVSNLVVCINACKSNDKVLIIVKMRKG